MNQIEKGFATIAVIAIFVVGIIAFFVYSARDNDLPNLREDKTSGFLPENFSTSMSPTPFPFQELTIHYLRERTYQSSIQNQDRISSNENYTSYLSSYDSDGLRINALLTVPIGDVPDGGWPAIVFVHGYIPPTLYQTTQSYADYVDYFARNGFVVLKTDLRGHGESEGIASGAYYSGDYVIDVLSAVAALSESDFVSPDNIGLWGHSMAGNVTFRAFVASQDIKALVIWSGAVYTYEDMQQFGIDDNSYRPPTDDSERQRTRNELREMYGTFSAESEFWQMVVPTNYLDSVNGSIQIHHATDDAVVSVDYSRNLLDVISGSNINTTLHEYTTGGHNISGSSFTTAMNRSVLFFRDKLQ